VITGANTGIGKATSENLYIRGARVIMLARSLDRANTAIAEIVDANANKGQDNGDKGSLEVVQMDLSSLESIRRAADVLVRRGEPVHALVMNAGLSMAPPGEATVDGYDMQMGTNHLGHFLLSELLAPLLKEAAARDPRPGHRPRLVIVSSRAHQRGRIRWDDFCKPNKSIASW